MAVQNHLGDLEVTMLPGVDPSSSNDMEFFPGISQFWSLSFMIDDEQAPTGRPAGALGWGGAANLFSWINAPPRSAASWSSRPRSTRHSRADRRQRTLGSGVSSGGRAPERLDSRTGATTGSAAGAPPLGLPPSGEGSRHAVPSGPAGHHRGDDRPGESASLSASGSRSCQPPVRGLLRQGPA
jgi:hypothetical protein